MRNHARTILTLTFLSALALATVCHAGPRPPKSVPASPALTATEDFCRIIGEVAYRHAQSRDNGASYLELLTALRSVPPKTPDQVKLATLFRDNLRIIYDYPALSTALIRQQTEFGCIKHFDPTTTATATADRY
jgi:hypothetical protein